MILFKEVKNNPNIVKVYLNGIYKGRIVKNDENLYEYQEIGHYRMRYMINLVGHPSLQDAQNEATRRVNRYLIRNLDN